MPRLSRRHAARTTSSAVAAGTPRSPRRPKWPEAPGRDQHQRRDPATRGSATAAARSRAGGPAPDAAGRSSSSGTRATGSTSLARTSQRLVTTVYDAKPAGREAPPPGHPVVEGDPGGAAQRQHVGDRAAGEAQQQRPAVGEPRQARRSASRCARPARPPRGRPGRQRAGGDRGERGGDRPPGRPGDRRQERTTRRRAARAPDRPRRGATDRGCGPVRCTDSWSPRPEHAPRHLPSPEQPVAAGQVSCRLLHRSCGMDRRVVIVSGSYGAGHDAAADALAQQLRSRRSRGAPARHRRRAARGASAALLRWLYFTQLRLVPRSWGATLRGLERDGRAFRLVRRRLLGQLGRRARPPAGGRPARGLHASVRQPGAGRGTGTRSAARAGGHLPHRRLGAPAVGPPGASTSTSRCTS